MEGVTSFEGPWGYNPPYQVFNTLTRLQNHTVKFPNGSLYVYNIPPLRLQATFPCGDTRHPQSEPHLGYDTNVLTTITDARTGNQRDYVPEDNGLSD
jgi:hypothetical protein